MIAISLLEFLSIGAILPLLEIIFTNSIDVKNSNFLNFFFDINENSIIILLSLIFFAFLFKNIFILIYTKFSSAFMMHLSLDIQRKTFESYLYRNYEELRNIDSNEILRDINGKPYFEPIGALKEYLDDLGIAKTHVSLSDEKQYAIAFAVLEKK